MCSVEGSACLSCRSSRGWLTLATSQLSSRTTSQPRLIFYSLDTLYPPLARSSPHQEELQPRDSPLTTDSFRQTRFGITTLHAYPTPGWLTFATFQLSSKAASTPRLIIFPLDNLYGPYARPPPYQKLPKAPKLSINDQSLLLGLSLASL
jgi:hypothetical protein